MISNIILIAVVVLLVLVYSDIKSENEKKRLLSNMLRDLDLVFVHFGRLTSCEVTKKMVQDIRKICSGVNFYKATIQDLQEVYSGGATLVWKWSSSDNRK